jgi:hypothetical protein
VIRVRPSNGKPCDEYTTGLLGWRPIQATFPFIYIGKEIERRAQEGGEDISILEGSGPIRYQAGRKAKTRSADPGLIAKARRHGVRQLMRKSGVSQHATERFLRCERVHPATRRKLADAVEEMERKTEYAEAQHGVGAFSGRRGRP